MSDLKFDPLSSKYQCCCGCHVKTGTVIICSLSIVGSLLLAVVSYPHLFVGICFGTIFALISASPIIGIKQLKPWLFIPFFCLLGLTIAFNAASVVFMAWTSDKFYEYGYTTDQILMITASGAFKTALNVWFFIILQRCYDYVSEMKAQKEFELPK
uniref:Uncharacterized protein n=1 Tax=Panagrolaimus sp. ES5 TaxID=591445 RepID=A0AC34FLU2_9BILA